MRTRATTEKRYQTEAALCEELVTHARAHGFRVYPETASQDLLLVAGRDARGFAEGDQIGVQAKLTANLTVLYQALPRMGASQQPHFYSVLLPFAPRDEFRAIARALKITVIDGSVLSYAGARCLFPSLRWWRHDHHATCWVPECEVVGMAAGTPAPKQLTKWKMQAVKLCMRGVDKGFLTSADFKEFEVSMNRWRQKGWISAYDTQIINKRRVIRYVLCDEKKPPHLLYGDVAAALEKAGAL